MFIISKNSATEIYVPMEVYLKNYLSKW